MPQVGYFSPFVKVNGVEVTPAEFGSSEFGLGNIVGGLSSSTIMLNLVILLEELPVCLPKKKESIVVKA